jgi:hypothetical protein
VAKVNTGLQEFFHRNICQTLTSFSNFKLHPHDLAATVSAFVTMGLLKFDIP